MGRRLLLLDVMPGHGRDNLLHELEQGGADVCGPAAADIARSALAAFDRAGPRADARAVPRWEPAFTKALGELGLDISAGDTDDHPTMTRTET